MMSINQQVNKAVQAGLLCVLAVAAQHVQAADSIVPEEWNVGPMRSGAYLEAFDSALLPAWAGTVGFNAVTNVFPTMQESGLPVRSNQWFDANVRVLQLETAGEVVTNTLSHPSDAPVTFDTDPVFVDMRMKFDPLTEVPDSSLLSNVKLALFVTGDSKLVAVHAGGISTNALEIDTNKWHQVTVKLVNGLFDVLLNDATVFAGLSVKASGVANTLSSANFFGTGFVDELYVGRGNPAYAVTGPTNAIPALPAEGDHPPTDEQQTLINTWLSTYPGVTPSTTLSLTQDQLSQAYLLDELGGDGTTATAVACDFGISKIEMSSPTLLTVTVSLKVDAANKEGEINGKIQLLGKAALGDSWTTLSGAVTPGYADFTNGEATYTFAIPEGGYTFFKPLIIP